MSSFNKVVLMGNLTRDPEMRYTPSGAAVANFGMAMNRKYKSGDEQKEEVCFVDITAWNKTAEIAAEYLQKGRMVMIEGRLNFRQWEDQSGQRRSKLEVVCERLVLMPRGENSGSGNGGNNRGRPRDDDSGGQWGDDDIPF